MFQVAIDLMCLSVYTCLLFTRFSLYVNLWFSMMSRYDREVERRKCEKVWGDDVMMMISSKPIRLARLLLISRASLVRPSVTDITDLGGERASAYVTLQNSVLVVISNSRWWSGF